MTILRAAGAAEDYDVDLQGRALVEFIREKIGAGMLDFVNLRDGRNMVVDDAGYEYEVVPTATGFEHRTIRALLPDNAKATALYHRICVPGTTHRIVGDVGIFREPEP